MKLSWIRISLLAFATSTAVHSEACSGNQCENFSATEQPYLYLYAEQQYRGIPLYLTNVSVPDLSNVPAGDSRESDFDDKASLLRVRGKWRVCRDTAYAGECAELSSSDWRSELKVDDVGETLGEAFDQSVSSVEFLYCGEY